MSTVYNGTSAYPTGVTLPDDGETIEASDVNVPIEGLADRTTFLRDAITPTAIVAADTTETYTVTLDRVLYRFTSAITAARTKTLSNAGPPRTGAIVVVMADPGLTQYVQINDGGGNPLWRLGNGVDSAIVGRTVDGPFAAFVYLGGWKLIDGTIANHGFAVFNASGTFTAPAYASSGTVFGWGGGGGGSSGLDGTTVTTECHRGGGGGGGALLGVVPVTWTPGATYPVTVGAGGNGGSNVSNTAGSDGGDSGVLGLTFRGGEGGRRFAYLANDTRVARGGSGEASTSPLTYVFYESSIGPQAGGHGGVQGPTIHDGGGGTTALVGRRGGRSPLYPGGPGGANGTAGGGYFGGGGGGGGGAGPGDSGGAGGSGGFGHATTGGNAGASTAGNANSGAGGGGGGAGGGAATTPGEGSDGSAGGSGRVIIVW